MVPIRRVPVLWLGAGALPDVHVTRALRLPCLFTLIVSAAAAACDRDKSRNPLSPGIRGPIAGVEIGSPRPLSPAAATTIRHDATTVTLTVENASTNGARPLTYVFEMATDASMAPVVHTRANVEPGADGRTSIEVPGPLTAGRTYYWHARATDGANTGPNSSVSHFTVVEPVVYSAPQLLSPVGGATLTTAQPELRAANAARTGPAEDTRYTFDVSLTGDFTDLATSIAVAEQPGQTATTAGPLQPGTLHFWRVRAFSASATGPWSEIGSFRTPSSGPVVPPPGTLPPSLPGGRPAPAEGRAMVDAVIANLRRRGVSMAGDCGAFEITRRVAWAFANRGAGLERKPGGRNCQGHSIDIVLFTDGQSVDMLVGAGVDNGATWQEHGVLPDWRDWWIAPTDPD